MEFIEGKQTKFMLTSKGHRLLLRAPSLMEKQQWVRYLRTGIISLNPQALASPLKQGTTEPVLEPKPFGQALEPSSHASPLHSNDPGEVLSPDSAPHPTGDASQDNTNQEYVKVGTYVVGPVIQA